MQSTIHHHRQRRHARMEEKYRRRANAETEHHLQEVFHNGTHAVAKRLAELEHEWSVEDILKLHAATFLLKFGLFGAIVNKKYFFGIAGIGALAMMQTIQGWSPPYMMIRKMGNRTRDEIDDERQRLLELLHSA